MPGAVQIQWSYVVGAFILSIYKERTWGMKGLSNFLKVKELASGRSRI